MARASSAALVQDPQSTPIPDSAATVRNIVLASSSLSRRVLLERLGIAFTVDSPAIDETPHAGEAPEALVRRLARSKAETVARRQPGAVIIGSDQVAVLDGRILGKPGDHAANVYQLLAASGRWVEFHTGICVHDNHTDSARVEVIPFAVKFRTLNATQVETYVSREQAFDCAGGFRAERLGAALFERMRGDDPNALIGLPLFTLVTMLQAIGIEVLEPVVIRPS